MNSTLTVLLHSMLVIEGEITPSRISREAKQGGSGTGKHFSFSQLGLYHCAGRNTDFKVKSD